MDKIKGILHQLEQPAPPQGLERRVMGRIAGESRPNRSTQYINCGVACLVASVLFFLCLQGPVLPFFNTASKTLRHQQERLSSSLVEIMRSASDFQFSKPGGN